MAKNQIRRRVSFFQLQAENNEDKKFLSKNEMHRIIIDFKENLPKNGSGNSYQIFSSNFNTYYIEFLKFNDDHMFVRIGKENAQNTIGKFDIEKGDLIDIELNETENIELYTYLYISWNNMIISYMKINGTPTEKVFSNLLSTLANDKSFSCVPIVTEDILKTLIKKDLVGTIQFTYCIPKDEVLRDAPGVSDSYLGNLNYEQTNVSVSIKPKRGTSLTHKLKELVEIKDNLIDRHGNNLKKIVVSARDEDEAMIGYNILEYKFSRYTYMDSNDQMDSESYYKQIKKVYDSEKSILENYIS